MLLDKFKYDVVHLIFLGLFFQGLTYPVAELFLEDVLEKTRYLIKSEADSFQGSSRRRQRQQDSKRDPLTELFEAWFLP